MNLNANDPIIFNDIISRVTLQLFSFIIIATKYQISFPREFHEEISFAINPPILQNLIHEQECFPIQGTKNLSQYDLSFT